MNIKNIHLKQAISQKLFLLIFSLVFCFSGILSLVSITSGWFTYRTGITASIFSIVILLLLGIKIDRVTFAFLALTVITILSGMYNGTSIQNIIFFLRNVVFSFLTYNAVQLCITDKNITRIMLWCVRVAIIQLPIVLFQKAIYPQLPTSVHANIASLDIGSGTFDINGDAAMGLFLVLMIIYLLFAPRHNYFIKYKWLISFWLTITIFIAEAELLKLIVAGVFLIFFLLKLRYQKVFRLFVVGLIFMAILATSGVVEKQIQDLAGTISGSLSTSQMATERFLEGEYARGAALYYYISRGIRLLGDGPSRYYDVQSRSRLIGNTGHLFSFYSEVGLLGWLCSVMIFFLIAFPIKNSKVQVSLSSLLNFLALMSITLTTFLMDNIAVLLIFFIMSMTHLIPRRRAEIPDKPWILLSQEDD